MQIREYKPSDEAELIALWQRCNLTRPWNSPARDITRKLHAQPNWMLVGVRESVLIASVMVGYDGHRGWINYLAVDPDYQKQGYGRQIMQEAESRLQTLGCPKINLQIRADNTQAIEFYRSIGFVEDSVISMGKRLVEDQQSQ